MENISDEKKELTRLICESIPPCFLSFLYQAQIPGIACRMSLPGP